MYISRVLELRSKHGTVKITLHCGKPSQQISVGWPTEIHYSLGFSLKQSPMKIPTEIFNQWVILMNLKLQIFTEIFSV